jgi:hypothetical protein
MLVGNPACERIVLKNEVPVHRRLPAPVEDEVKGDAF